MENTKKGKRICIWIMAIILTAAYIARVYYVNVKYKIPIEVYHIGDAVEIENFILTMEDVQCYKMEDFFKTYPDMRKDYYMQNARPDRSVQYIAVCTVTVACKNAGVQDYEIYVNSMRFANDYSGCDLPMSEDLSGGSLCYYADEQQAGEAFKAYLVYEISDNYMSEKLAKRLGSLELQYEISCYPIRKYISLGCAADHLTKAGE